MHCLNKYKYTVLNFLKLPKSNLKQIQMHSGFAAILRSLKMSSICLKFLKLSSKQTLNPTPQMCPQYKYRKYK